MIDLSNIIASYDFHLFIVERRDGSHFVGSLYKSKSKAMSVAQNYIKDDPFHLKRAYVFKIGVDTDNVSVIENANWVEDESVARRVEDDRCQQEADFIVRHLLSEMCTGFTGEKNE